MARVAVSAVSKTFVVKTLAYLFTEEFLVDNIYGSFINDTCKLNFYRKA